MRKELFASKKGLFVLLGLMAMGVLVMMPLGCGGSSSGTGSSATYTVGGAVAGLNGTGTVVLQNNAGDDLSLSSNGTFAFSTALADGAGYDVQVSGQPSGQTCTASSNSGTISGGNITNVSVICTTMTYTVGGTVSGLTGTVTLQNNSTDDLPLNSNGAFTFTTALANGAGYDVQVSGQPSGQTCTVSSNSGTISGGNISSVDVSCLDNVSLSGIVLDPSGTGVGDATVDAYRYDDSTLISSTTSAATGSFTITGIPKSVEIYLKAGKTGYVSGNTRTKTLTANDTGTQVMMLQETDAKDVANALAGLSEPSWDSTLQASGYLVMDAEDANTDDLGGLTVIASPSLAILYDTVSGGSEAYTTTPPTSGTIDSTIGRNLPMMGAAISSTFGSYAMTGAVVPGTLEETAINAPIIPGEFTYFEWYQSSDVVKLNAVDEDYVDFGSMAGFTYSTDWSIIEKVQIPANADTTVGKWHTFRGYSDNNFVSGDLAIGFAHYVHNPPFPDVTPGIQALYSEADGSYTLLKKDMTLVKGNWYTVCLQYDYSANSLALYVNGSAAPATTTVVPADDRANTDPLYWGGQYSDTNNSEGDLFDEEDVTFANQAWYQRLLTPAEIDAYDGAVDNTDPTLFFSTQVDTANTVVHDVQGGPDGINGNSPVYSFQ